MVETKVVETTPTPHGIFFRLRPEQVSSGWMLKVDARDYEAFHDKIDAISAVVLMVERMISNPSTGRMAMVEVNA